MNPIIQKDVISEFWHLVYNTKLDYSEFCERNNFPHCADTSAVYKDWLKFREAMREIGLSTLIETLTKS